MDLIVYPGKLNGNVQAIPSKSQAHRLLICAAFSEKPTNLICPETNRDIEATASCLNALGANIQRTSEGYSIQPMLFVPREAVLCCQDSGSTLRFMLPIVGALGVDATFQMTGRLPYRPLSPLWEEMERMGCTLSKPQQDSIRCNGKLRPGHYTIAGNVSSQFISGLLFALTLMDGRSTLTVTGTIESRPYISMTRNALALFGANIEGDSVIGSFPLTSPGKLSVEGDWSNAAFFLAAQAMGSPITVGGLSSDSAQGDRAVFDILKAITDTCSINASDIPDLVPILSVAAAANQGATFSQVQRLRLKESDRVLSVKNMLSALGIHSSSTEEVLTVYPGRIHGGTVDSCNDHRIAMSAAIAATVADGPVIIKNAQCVEKSYPSFWDEYGRLGGRYEQYIR